MIVAAAVRVNGKIYRGRRHGAAIHAAIEAGEQRPITSKMQGFVTDAGVFITRKMGRDYAIKCGQIKFNKKRDWKPLISEELW